MDAWICESCGAQIKQKDEPLRCILCNRRSSFTHVDIEVKKDEVSDKYEEALKKLEEYEEGAPKKKLSSYACSCNKD